jgi:hypothetical protein
VALGCATTGFDDPDRHDEVPARTLRSFTGKSYAVAGVEIPTKIVSIAIMIVTVNAFMIAVVIAVEVTGAIASMLVVRMAAVLATMIVMMVAAMIVTVIQVMVAAAIASMRMVMMAGAIAVMNIVMVAAVIAMMIVVMMAALIAVMVVVIVAAAITIVIGMMVIGMNRGRGLLREGHGVGSALGDHPDLSAVDVRHGEDLDRAWAEPEARRRRHATHTHPDVRASQVLHEGRPTPSVLVENPDRRLTDRELLAVVEPLRLVGHDDGERLLRPLEADELLAGAGRYRDRLTQERSRLAAIRGLLAIRKLVHRQRLSTWRGRSIDRKAAIGLRHMLRMPT